MVSSMAFQAFSCEPFDDGKSYLRADYSVQCYGADHARSKRLAWVGIVCYPIGVLVLYAVLLLKVTNPQFESTTLSPTLSLSLSLSLTSSMPCCG